MARTLDVLDRMAAMGVSPLEMHALMGTVAARAPEALDEALDRLEKRRTAKRAAETKEEAA